MTQSSKKNDVLAFAEAVLHGDKEHREWLMEAAECWVAGKPLPEPDTAWIPKIGDPVRVADHCADSELWNRDPIHVLGISRNRLGSGKYSHEINVTVSTDWPDFSDATDGFLINKENGPDDLLPA